MNVEFSNYSMQLLWSIYKYAITTEFLKISYALECDGTYGAGINGGCNCRHPVSCIKFLASFLGGRFLNIDCRSCSNISFSGNMPLACTIFYDQLSIIPVLLSMDDSVDVFQQFLRSKLDRPRSDYLVRTSRPVFSSPDNIRFVLLWH